jgi:hypothetical protein
MKKEYTSGVNKDFCGSAFVSFEKIKYKNIFLSKF